MGFSVAALVAAAAVTQACLTDPPPDLPLYSQPPFIDHNNIRPSEATPLTALPSSFDLHITVADPTALCQWAVYDVDTNSQYWGCTPCGAPSGKDGKVPVDFTVVAGPSFDPALCHHIRFTVGGTFGDSQCRSGGSDVADWYYAPSFASCVSYDASALGDGAFPDASFDGLAVVPDGGP